MYIIRFNVKNYASHFTQCVGVFLFLFFLSIAIYLLKGRGNRSLSGTQEPWTCNPGKLSYLQRVWKMSSPLYLGVCVSR